MSKTAQSGLRTVRRDFSAPSLSQSSEIEWLPTPPNPGKQKHSGPGQRLKDIEYALSSKASEISRGQALVDSKNINKRTSPVSYSGPPTKKHRQLPDSWLDDPIMAPTLSSSSARSGKISEPTEQLKKPRLAKVFLSQEQSQILKLVSEGQSIFYTGSAGTGKSVLLREIIKSLRARYNKSPDVIAITASTGIAACNIGGVTIHSFAGIGLGNENVEELAKKVRKNRKASTRWTRTKVLIIDEISMVDGDLFDKLSHIGGVLRKSSQPFGGIQIVVTGDFFQLPPVGKNTSQVKFAFEAETWKTAVKHTYNLTKVFRQTDQEFIDMLNEMRFGKLSNESIRKFKSLSRDIICEDGLTATELFPRREDVERSNEMRLSRLQTQMERFLSIDGGTIRDENQRQKMLANFMAPRDLPLRVDSQVMLIKNIDDTLVNGSMGRVLRFVDPAVYGTELDIDDPHTSPLNVIGASNVISGVGSAAKKNAPKATVATKLYPVVEFSIPHGGKRNYLVMPEVWKVELPDGEVQVSRTQLPLILSWAMSIHKSQGQTLDRVKVDLGKVFEKGQAYVALSRATSLQGLQVLNFDPNKVKAHPKVAIWSTSLATIKDEDNN